MRAFVAALVAITLALLANCHRGEVGVFSATGYTDPEYGYLVHYANPALRALMPPDWEFDNLYVDGRRIRARTGADYQSTLFLDVDQDGTEDNLGKVQTFDLRFKHRKTAGVVSLRTIPIDLDMRDKELRVMLGSVVESISGSGYETIQLEGNLYLANKEHRYAAKVLSASKAVLAGNEAYAAVVDVSNVDRLRVDPKAVDVRAMIVLARTGLAYAHTAKVKFPVLMMASYTNAPEDFDASLPDFKGLLGRIELGGHMGFDMQTAEPDASVVEPAPVPESDAAIAPTPVPEGGSSDAGAPEASRSDANR